MSKRELKNYLSSLKKKELEEQIIDLYGRFKEVKTFYDFAFHPKEELLLEKSKFDISKEYFPVGRQRKAKARRSVAQKYIRQFIRLGVAPWIVAEVMVYNLEIAQTYASGKEIRQDAFFVSMLKSFEEAVNYILEQGLRADFSERIKNISDEAWEQNWFNKTAFERLSGPFHAQEMDQCKKLWVIDKS